MKLVYGTTNKSKIIYMKRQIEPLGIEVLSLDDVGAPPLSIDECGAGPLENAEIKALAYFRALNMAVFSCDSGLYIKGLEDARQPGVHIRNIEGRRLDDNEMIEQYSLLAAELGGSAVARYQNAICLVLDESRIFRHMDDDIASERFLLVSNPHWKRVEGFPLDSLSVDIASGRYYYDIEGYKRKYATDGGGFAAFFKAALSIS